MIQIYTTSELKKMSLEDAKSILSEKVYENTRLIELLEGVGKIKGNGHHIRQKLSADVEKILEERWIK